MGHVIASESNQATFNQEYVTATKSGTKTRLDVLAGAGGGGLQNLETKATGTRSVSSTATNLSVSGTGLNAETTLILVENQSSQTVFVRVGTDPTTSAGFKLYANEARVFPITAAETIKGIVASSTATCWVEELGPA